jgi:integrase
VVVLPCRPGPSSTFTEPLRRALNDAVHVEQIIATNPAERAKRPRTTRREVVQVWSPEQLRTFLATAETHRLSAFYHLAAYTGARRGELLFLRWSDLALDNLELIIGGSTSVVDKRRVDGTTKGDQARIVSIDHGTVAVLREHRARQVTERLKAGSLWQGSHQVFTTDSGSPLHPDTPSQLMPKLIKAAGLPHARLHDLRHLHATTLLLAGVPAHVVANRLGHADASITLRVYAHVLRENTADVGGIFASAISWR